MHLGTAFAVLVRLFDKVFAPYYIHRLWKTMFHATTILCVRHNGHVAMAGDGQVTIGDTVVKQGARKIRKLYNGRVLAGFAGSAADGMALFSKFESKLEEFRGNLKRASV